MVLSNLLLRVSNSKPKANLGPFDLARFASESALPVLTGDVDAGPHCVSPTQGGERGLIGVGLSSINAQAGRESAFP